MEIEAQRRVTSSERKGNDAVAPMSFEEFFLEEHDRLYRALFFITGSSHEADDLAQEAFAKLWERWDRIDRIDDPTAYLFRIALNGFRTRLRRAKVASRHVLPVAQEPQDPFKEIELREDVRRMLVSLPTRQRAALVLTEIIGYDSAQAGAILGIRAATVRALASQGRAALRAP